MIRKISFLALALTTGLVLAQPVAITIGDVIPDGAAAAAGLRGGDRLLAIGDKPIRSQDDLEAALDGFSPGDTTKIRIQRGSEEKTISLTFGERDGGRASMGVMLQASRDPAVDTQQPIDAARKSEVLLAVAGSLRDGYVFEDKGRTMARQIEQAVESDRFADATTLASFVSAANEYLFEISNDKHLRIGFGAPRHGGGRTVRVQRGDGAEPAHGETSSPEGGRRVVRRGPGGGSDPTFGVRDAKVLDGNVGYLDLRMFAGDDTAKPAIDEAMLKLATSDALIIDLGRNGGGSVWMVRYLSGFLFAEKTLLAETMARGMEAPAERWTLDGQPTDAFHDKPVYILTSGRTFSAAESFTFGLKTKERVTLVGERTGGGGHFGQEVVLGDDLRFFLPVGRTYDPATGVGFEAEGLAPDIEVAYADALARAVEAATN